MTLTAPKSISLALEQIAPMRQHLNRKGALNQAVYELFGLTVEEVRLVEHQ